MEKIKNLMSDLIIVAVGLAIGIIIGTHGVGIGKTVVLAVAAVAIMHLVWDMADDRQRRSE